MNRQAKRDFDVAVHPSNNERNSGGETHRHPSSQSAQHSQDVRSEDDGDSSYLTISSDEIDELRPLRRNSQQFHQLGARERHRAGWRDEDVQNNHRRQKQRINPKMFNRMPSFDSSGVKNVAAMPTRGGVPSDVEELQRFLTAGVRERFRTKLRQRRRQRGESLQTVHDDVRWLFGLAYPGASGAMSNLIVRDIFLDSLGDDDFRKDVLERQPLDVGEALSVAARLERLRRTSDDNRTPACLQSSSKLLPRATAGAAVYDAKFMSDQVVMKHHQRKQSRLDQFREDMNLPSSDVDVRGTRVPTSAVQQRDCTRIRAYRTDNCQGHTNVFLHMTVNGIAYPVIIDTGCENSLVPFAVVNHLKLSPIGQRVFAVNGTELKILGAVFLAFHLNDLSTSANLLVTPDVEETMLGVDWLRANDCHWDFGNEVLYVNGNQMAMSAESVGVQAADDVSDVAEAIL